ncbi:hypothetical protein ACQJBY_005671 [Aegilops geniculata]
MPPRAPATPPGPAAAKFPAAVASPMPSAFPATSPPLLRSRRTTSTSSTPATSPEAVAPPPSHSTRPRRLCFASPPHAGPSALPRLRLDFRRAKSNAAPFCSVPGGLQVLVCPAASPNPAARTLQRRRFLPPVVSVSSETRAAAASSIWSGALTASAARRFRVASGAPSPATARKAQPACPSALSTDLAFGPCFGFRSGVVRIRSTTSACLLHGLVLLPSGISGKMTISSKSLLSLLPRLLALLLCLCCDTYHLLIMPPILLNQASNPPCPSTVVWLCYRFAQPLL